MDGDAPIRWWHATETRTRDGMGTTGNEAPPILVATAPGGVLMGGEVHLHYRSSIASTQMVRVLKAATVIIDANRASGTALDSVAAFAALVSLAEIRMTDDPPPGSILGLFGPGGPDALTSLDLSFFAPSTACHWIGQRSRNAGCSSKAWSIRARLAAESEYKSLFVCGK